MKIDFLSQRHGANTRGLKPINLNSEVSSPADHKFVLFCLYNNDIKIKAD